MADISTPRESAPFDLQGLHDMYGEDTVAELLHMSVDEAGGLVQQITDAVEQKDSKQLMTAAHQLKGLASTMTINELAKLSFDLETAARQQNWTEVASTVTALEAEFKHLAAYVAEVLG